MKAKLIIGVIMAIGVALQYAPQIVDAGARWMPCDPKCK
jgi:hypothetical protein